MGVYIKGMEMPTKGYRLILVDADGTVYTTDGETTAISVPEPHGDLIDKNELTMCSYDLDNYFWFQAVPEETLNEARVIIPASEEE